MCYPEMTWSSGSAVAVALPAAVMPTHRNGPETQQDPIRLKTSSVERKRDWSEPGSDGRMREVLRPAREAHRGRGILAASERGAVCILRCSDANRSKVPPHGGHVPLARHHTDP